MFVVHVDRDNVGSGGAKTPTKTYTFFFVSEEEKLKNTYLWGD